MSAETQRERIEEVVRNALNNVNPSPLAVVTYTDRILALLAAERPDPLTETQRGEDARWCEEMGTIADNGAADTLAIIGEEWADPDAPSWLTEAQDAVARWRRLAAYARAEGPEQGSRYCTAHTEHNPLCGACRKYGPRPEQGRTVEGWQPIETAPKDGTRLLLWDPKRDIAVSGCWHHEAPGFDDPGWSWWATDGDVILWDSGPDDAPTHWMPFPAPPTLTIHPE